MKRIAFVAPPFAGHLNPQLVLAQAARDAGYAVTVITGERKLETVRSVGLTAIGPRSIGPGSLEAIANSPTQIGSNPFKLLRLMRENLALLPAIRDELIALWRAERPDLVVADSVAPVAGLACESLGIPWITTIATPFAIENHRGVPAYCGGWKPGSPLRDAAGRLAVRSFKRAACWVLRREVRALGGEFPYRPDGSESVYSPLAILGFGIAELEFARDWPECFTMLGPAIECPETVGELAYPDGRPRVLVSVGTHLLWAKRTLVADVERLAAAFPGVSFVVSMGGAEAPARIGRGNVTVVPMVPYARDLREFDAVIHHGGAGVTYAAILNGIPSVVVPHDYDQFDFAARVEHFDLGLRAGSLHAARGALGPVLERKEWPALKQMQECALRYRPVERFLAKLDELGI